MPRTHTSQFAYCAKVAHIHVNASHKTIPVVSGAPLPDSPGARLTSHTSSINTAECTTAQARGSAHRPPFDSSRAPRAPESRPTGLNDAPHARPASGACPLPHIHCSVPHYCPLPRILAPFPLAPRRLSDALQCPCTLPSQVGRRCLGSHQSTPSLLQTPAVLRRNRWRRHPHRRRSAVLMC